MRAWFDSQFPFFIVVHWHFNILGWCAMKVGDLFYETVEFTEYYYLHYESTMGFKIHSHWSIDWSLRTVLQSFVRCLRWFDFVTFIINRKNLPHERLRTETLTVVRLAATMIAGHNMNLSLQYQHRKAKCLHDFHHLRASRCFPCWSQRPDGIVSNRRILLLC